jgi:hypothetical protein
MNNEYNNNNNNNNNNVGMTISAYAKFYSPK